MVRFPVWLSTEQGTKSAGLLVLFPVGLSRKSKAVRVQGCGFDSLCGSVQSKAVRVQGCGFHSLPLLRRCFSPDRMPGVSMMLMLCRTWFGIWEQISLQGAHRRVTSLCSIYTSLCTIDTSLCSIYTLLCTIDTVIHIIMYYRYCYTHHYVL